MMGGAGSYTVALTHRREDRGKTLAPVFGRRAVWLRVELSVGVGYACFGHSPRILLKSNRAYPSSARRMPEST
jgi:hypothetical protein